MVGTAPIGRASLTPAEVKAIVADCFTDTNNELTVNADGTITITSPLTGQSVTTTPHPELTAGDGITIVDNVITATVVDTDTDTRTVCTFALVDGELVKTTTVIDVVTGEPVGDPVVEAIPLPSVSISGKECNQTTDDGGIYTPKFGTTTTRRFLPNALGEVTEVLSHDDLAALPVGQNEISVIEYEITNNDCVTRGYLPKVTANIQYGNIGPDVVLWSGVDGSSPVGFSGAGVMSIDNRHNPDPYLSGHQDVHTAGGEVILAPGQSATFRSAAYVWIFSPYNGPSVGVPPGTQAIALNNHIMQIQSYVVDDNPADVFGGAGGNP